MLQEADPAAAEEEAAQAAAVEEAAARAVAEEEAAAQAAAEEAVEDVNQKNDNSIHLISSERTIFASLR